MFFYHPLIRLGVATFVLVALIQPTSALAWSFGSVLPSEEAETPIAEWTAKEGDAFIVDTKTNMGYLVHPDRGYTSFPVVTGQRRAVRYIGRTYNATTPVRSWSSGDIHVKRDFTTFGSRGIFIRLFHEGEKTPYGIHSHKYVDVMMARDDRFGSMGCVIVTEEILDIILDTYAKNADTLAVVTEYGLTDAKVNFEVLKEIANRSSIPQG
ncbi:MAG: hypothetical protein ABL890_00595 [Candidatus Peribacteraceae bacterium]